MGLFNKETKLVRTFQPPPTPPPQRILSGGEVDEQKQCLFLSMLPSEIRNEIYYLVFGVSTTTEEEGENIKNEAVGGDEREISFQSLRCSTSNGFGNQKQSSDMGLRLSRTSELRREQDRTPAAQNSDADTRTGISSNDLELDLQEARPDVEPSVPAHGLSLLLTCRKISQEATILAFNTYTFAIASSKLTTFFALRQSTAHLSREQFSAITTLALDLPLGYTNSYQKAAEFISNAMLLFTTVQRLTIRVQKGRTANQQAHMQDIFPTSNDGGPVRDEALRRYVPNWLSGTVHYVVDGRSFSWQTGYKWRVEWPQFNSPVYVEAMEYVGPTDGWNTTGSMPPEAAGVVDGVELCVCGCGELCWLTAHLVQETGRQVKVGVVYYGDAETEELRMMRVKLKTLANGMYPLPLTWLQGGDAAVWDVTEKYWNDLRARNGNLMAIWKSRTWRLWGSSGFK
jgi:hypothetical protein